MRKINIIKQKISPIFIIVGLIIFFYPINPYPQEVINTFKACEWCSEHHTISCVNKNACEICCYLYKKANGLNDSFKTLCWDEFIPLTNEFLFKTTLAIFLVALGMALHFEGGRK